MKERREVGEGGEGGGKARRHGSAASRGATSQRRLIHSGLEF